MIGLSVVILAYNEADVLRATVEEALAWLAFLQCPSIHHSRIRTTNLLERAFAEQRRRTKTIPHFFNEKSCLKLGFATLWQASEHWQNVRMSDVECKLA